MTPVPKPGQVEAARAAEEEEARDREDLPATHVSRPRGYGLAVEVSGLLNLPRPWTGARAAAAPAGARGRGVARLSWLELLALQVGRVVVEACSGNRAQLVGELRRCAVVVTRWADAVERRG